MLKPEQLWLPGRIPISSGFDSCNGRWFIGYSKGASQYFTCAKELRRWLKLPVGTASRQAFDAWITSLEAADAERTSKKDGPAVSADREPASIAEQSIESSWDPLAHTLDESDPQFQTRTVI